jgi:hypothetical protein
MFDEPLDGFEYGLFGLVPGRVAQERLGLGNGAAMAAMEVAAALPGIFGRGGLAEQLPGDGFQGCGLPDSRRMCRERAPTAGDNCVDLSGTPIREWGDQQRPRNARAFLLNRIDSSRSVCPGANETRIRSVPTRPITFMRH